MKAYKGYTAEIWLDTEDRCFHGTVEGIRDTIHFCGASLDELERAFCASVDEYLAWCAQEGTPPDRPFSGRLAFRTTPQHHRLIARAAAAEAKSINQWMDDVLADAAAQRLADGRQRIRQR